MRHGYFKNAVKNTAFLFFNSYIMKKTINPEEEPEESVVSQGHQYPDPLSPAETPPRDPRPEYPNPEIPQETPPWEKEPETPPVIPEPELPPGRPDEPEISPEPLPGKERDEPLL